LLPQPRRARADEPAPGRALRTQRPPPRRGAVQGGRARPPDGRRAERGAAGRRFHERLTLTAGPCARGTVPAPSPRPRPMLHDQTFAVLGAGNIGTAIIGGLLRGGDV